MTQHDAGAPRSAEERGADHAAIERLADELLPALVAKLGASGLGELDIREGGWRVRLRMPGDGRATRRAGAPGRGPGSAGPGGPGGAGPGGHPSRPASGPGSRGSAPTPADPAASDLPPGRTVATAPAVGFFRPHSGIAAGVRVRAGDRLATIDVLGVGHELASPADGIVGATLVNPGDPVEYGQEVVEIELLVEPAPRTPEDA